MKKSIRELFLGNIKEEPADFGWLFLEKSITATAQTVVKYIAPSAKWQSVLPGIVR